MDNSSPVGNGGSPRHRVKISPIINASFDKKLISQMTNTVRARAQRVLCYASLPQACGLGVVVNVG